MFYRMKNVAILSAIALPIFMLTACHHATNQKTEPIQIAEETLTVSDREAFAYQQHVDAAQRGDDEALRALLQSYAYYDAAAAIGHGVVLYKLKLHNQMQFDRVLSNETLEVQNRTSTLLDVGEAYYN